MRGGWRACAGRCARRELARLHLQPTHSCPALDSSVHSAASSTASTTTVGDKVAAIFLGGASFFSTTLCSSRGYPVATRRTRGRPGASRRRLWRLRQRGSAAAIFGQLGRPARALRRLCGLCRAGQPRMLCASRAPEKMCACERSLWGISVCLSARMCASGRPQLRATRRYAARVLGPRTQSITTPPIRL